MSNLRTNLIRLAATMPKGSEDRKALLDVLATDKEASDTWYSRLRPLQNQFLREVVAEAEGLFGDAGATNVQTGPNFIAGQVSGQKFSVQWNWTENGIGSVMALGSKRRNGDFLPLSKSPMNIASESIYAHFQGLLS